jgi:hypothetical protein
MTKPAKSRQSDQGKVRALIIGSIGLAAIIALGFLVPALILWDMMLLFIVVVFVAIGSTQNILQGLSSSIMLYIALGITATFYHFMAPYARSFLNLQSLAGLNTNPGGAVDYNALAFSFVLLWIVVWTPLEILSRTLFPDTSLPALGFLDVLGGIAIYLIIGLVVSSILLTVLGYSLSGRIIYNNAYLGPFLKPIFRLYYTAQSIWFLGHPPAIYAYNL